MPSSPFAWPYTSHEPLSAWRETFALFQSISFFHESRVSNTEPHLSICDKWGLGVQFMATSVEGYGLIGLVFYSIYSEIGERKAPRASSILKIKIIRPIKIRTMFNELKRVFLSWPGDNASLIALLALWTGTKNSTE